MRKSMFRTSVGGKGRSGGGVSVIEVTTQRSAVRRAKLAFWIALAVTWLVIGELLLVTTDFHVLFAIVAAGAFSVVVAAATFLVVVSWPVIRVVWHWLPEIVLGTATVTGVFYLADTLPRWAVIPVLAATAFVLLLRPVSRFLVAWAWCLISRHRLRLCFAAFIASNRYGTLPLILWARPTLAGERIWVWLRPGLSRKDLEDRLDKIAVTCWAAQVKVERASRRNEAFVRVDIARRNAFDHTVESPLPQLVDPAITGAVTAPPADTLPTALDLPDVSEVDITAAADDKPKRRSPRAVFVPGARRPADDQVHDDPWIPEPSPPDSDEF